MTSTQSPASPPDIQPNSLRADELQGCAPPAANQANDRQPLFPLLLATTYALVVTFSRNGYSAFAVACLLSLLAVLWLNAPTGYIGDGVMLLGGATVAMALTYRKLDTCLRKDA